MTAGTLFVRVASKRLEATDIYSFELVRPGGEPLPRFSPGAHIDVFVPGGPIRQYSLCNDAAETHRYVIGVLRDPASRGGSQAMHESVNEGDVISIGEPRNNFTLRLGAAHSVLIAGGIGITPLLCMARHLASIGASFELHYFCRSRSRAAFQVALSSPPFDGRAHLHVSESSGSSNEAITHLLANLSMDAQLYVCGPEGFIEKTLLAARERGWAEDDVHIERFAPVSHTDSDSEPFDLHLARTGTTVHVPSGVSAAQALAQAGIEIALSCEQGVCGTCVTRVLGGIPDHRDMFLLPEEQAQNDRFTPCCSRARSASLIVDL